jgi:hypothetical protein
MALDLKSGSGGDPERERLRSILRQWDAPAPPPEIEEGLRRAFRRRRTRGRLPLWLSLAAALALLLLGQVDWTHRRPSAASPVPALRSSTPHPLSPPAASLDRSVSRPTASVAVVHEPPGVKRGSATEAVVVEPGQRELLVELAERLRSRRQPRTVVSAAAVESVPAGARGRSTLEVAPTEVPRYEARWEGVADEWPLVQLSTTMLGR